MTPPQVSVNWGKVPKFSESDYHPIHFVVLCVDSYGSPFHSLSLLRPSQHHFPFPRGSPGGDLLVLVLQHVTGIYTDNDDDVISALLLEDAAPCCCPKDKMGDRSTSMDSSGGAAVKESPPRHVLGLNWDHL